MYPLVGLLQVLKKLAEKVGDKPEFERLLNDIEENPNFKKMAEEFTEEEIALYDKLLGPEDS